MLTPRQRELRHKDRPLRHRLRLAACGLRLGAKEMPSQYAGTVRAPAFPANVEWFNTEPLTVPQLRGKVVILDFWTYC